MGWHDHRGHVATEVNVFEERIKKILAEAESVHVYHSRQYWPDGKYLDIGLLGANIEDHIACSCKHQPSSALFINGECIYNGCLTDEELGKYTKDLARLQIKIPPSGMIDIQVCS